MNIFGFFPKFTLVEFWTKGPSINDVSSEGEGGGTPQKKMKGDIGRDPVFSRGDIFFKTPKSP